LKDVLLYFNGRSETFVILVWFGNFQFTFSDFC